MDALQGAEWTTAPLVEAATSRRHHPKRPPAVRRQVPSPRPKGERRRQPCSMDEHAGIHPARAPPASTAIAPAKTGERARPRTASAAGLCPLSLTEETVGEGGGRMGIGLSGDSAFDPLLRDENRWISSNGRACGGQYVGPQALIGPNLWRGYCPSFS
jgi:hypothetical protein